MTIGTFYSSVKKVALHADEDAIVQADDMHTSQTNDEVVSPIFRAKETGIKPGD